MSDRSVVTAEAAARAKLEEAVRARFSALLQEHPGLASVLPALAANPDGVLVAGGFVTATVMGNTAFGDIDLWAPAGRNAPIEAALLRIGSPAGAYAILLPEEEGEKLVLPLVPPVNVANEERERERERERRWRRQQRRREYWGEDIESESESESESEEERPVVKGRFQRWVSGVVQVILGGPDGPRSDELVDYIGGEARFAASYGGDSPGAVREPLILPPLPSHAILTLRDLCYNCGEVDHSFKGCTRGAVFPLGFARKLVRQLENGNRLRTVAASTLSNFLNDLGSKLVAHALRIAAGNPLMSEHVQQAVGVFLPESLASWATREAARVQNAAVAALPTLLTSAEVGDLFCIAWPEGGGGGPALPITRVAEYLDAISAEVRTSCVLYITSVLDAVAFEIIARASEVSSPHRGTEIMAGHIRRAVLGDKDLSDLVNRMLTSSTPQAGGGAHPATAGSTKIQLVQVMHLLPGRGPGAARDGFDLIACQVSFRIERGATAGSHVLHLEGPGIRDALYRQTSWSSRAKRELAALDIAAGEHDFRRILFRGVKYASRGMDVDFTGWCEAWRAWAAANDTTRKTQRKAATRILKASDADFSLVCAGYAFAGSPKPEGQLSESSDDEDMKEIVEAGLEQVEEDSEASNDRDGIAETPVTITVKIAEGATITPPLAPRSPHAVSVNLSVALLVACALQPQYAAILVQRAQSSSPPLAPALINCALAYACGHAQAEAAARTLLTFPGASPADAMRLVGTGSERFALSAALEAGLASLALTLIQRGAPIDVHVRHASANFRTPAITAAASMQPMSAALPLLKELLNRGADVNASGAMRAAISTGEIARVQLFLERGASVTRRSGDGATPLITALQRGFVDIATLLLARSDRQVEGTFDARGYNALYWAQTSRASSESEQVRGQYDVIIARLARPEITDAFLHVMRITSGNGYGFEMMPCVDLCRESRAAGPGSPPELFLGVRRSGAVDTKGKNGTTRLMVASERGDAERVRFLLSTLGADPNLRDTQGATALHRASQAGHPHIVRLLLHCGADASLLRSFCGRTVKNRSP
jgi:hypothetical protein